MEHIKSVLEIAEAANQNSELKIITSVGKIYTKIFDLPDLGFTKLIEINKDNWDQYLPSYPSHKSGKAKDRTFSLYKSESGSLYYNTWHKGGNKQPSDDWHFVEEFVLNYI